MNDTLNFEKEKVQSITLEQLAATHEENDIYGKPLKGIYHHELIGRVMGMCRSHGYEPEVYDLFAAKNNERQAPGVVLLPAAEEVYGKNAVQAHILRRVFANIRLRDFDDERNTTNIAVAFHQRGIQAGFGNMVKMCHNQCMLNASHYASTYGGRGGGKEERPDVDGLLGIIDGWLAAAREGVMADRRKMERMRGIAVPPDSLYKMVGQLTCLRVRCDTSVPQIRLNRTYPLNQAQISLFAERLMEQAATQGGVTLWDVYNSATTLYKADRMDIPQMLPQNIAMLQFLETCYDLAE